MSTDQALLAAYREHRTAVKQDRDWFEKRFLTAMDEQGKGWCFKQEKLTRLALYDFMRGSYDPKVCEIARRFMVEVFSTDDARTLITQHKTKAPAKRKTDEIVFAVRFFLKQGCTKVGAYELTRQALDLKGWNDKRIAQAYDRATKPSVDVMLSEAEFSARNKLSVIASAVA